MRVIFFGDNINEVIEYINSKYKGKLKIEIITMSKQINLEANIQVFEDIDRLKDYIKTLLDEEVVFIIDNNYKEVIESLFTIKDNIFNLGVFRIENTHHNIYTLSQKKKDKYLYLQKKRCIEKCGKVMMNAGIKKLNIKLINNYINKSNNLEANIIRLLIDNKININMLEASNINELLDEKNSNSIYYNNINMLMFNSFEMQSFFLQISKRLLCDEMGEAVIYNKCMFHFYNKNDSFSSIYYVLNSLIKSRNTNLKKAIKN